LFYFCKNRVSDFNFACFLDALKNAKINVERNFIHDKNMESDKDIKQRLNDYISKTPEIKTTIHWWDLYEGHYIKIASDLQEHIFQKAIKKAGGHFTWLEKN